MLEWKQRLLQTSLHNCKQSGLVSNTNKMFTTQNHPWRSDRVDRIYRGLKRISWIQLLFAQLSYCQFLLRPKDLHFLCAQFNRPKKKENKFCICIFTKLTEKKKKKTFSLHYCLTLIRKCHWRFQKLQILKCQHPEVKFKKLATFNLSTKSGLPVNWSFLQAQRNKIF